MINKLFRKIGTETREGQGVFVETDGSVKEGIWKNDRLEGMARIVRK